MDQPRGKKFFCAGVSRSGSACRAFAHGESAFCIFHDPTYRERQRANSALGGHRSGQARATREDEIVPIDLSTPRARADVLGFLLGATLQGRLSDAQCAMANRILAISSRNTESAAVDPAVVRMFLGRAE